MELSGSLASRKCLSLTFWSHYIGKSKVEVYDWAGWQTTGVAKPYRVRAKRITECNGKKRGGKWLNLRLMYFFSHVSVFVSCLFVYISDCAFMFQVSH